MRNLDKQFTFTISFDDLAILFRVNPVFRVSHLVPFTRLNLTTGFRWKFFDRSEGNYVRKNEFQERSLHHHAVRYLLMRQERKKTSNLSCLRKSRKKEICANSIRSRLRSEMEHSNNNAAKQANISISSSHHFQVD